MTKPKRDDDKPRRVNIYFSAELDDRLNRFCEANHNVPRSRVIRDALKDFLNKEKVK